MPDDPTSGMLGSLSLLDRLLPVWIFVAMGSRSRNRLHGSANRSFDKFIQIHICVATYCSWLDLDDVSTVRRAVNYRNIGRVVTEKKMISLSLVLNWTVGPFLMFGLAWIFLPDLPLFRDGVIIVGLARCIAMVLVWNMLAGGNSEYAAIIVALNAAFQIAFYSVYAYFFITLLPAWINPSVSATVVKINPWDVALSVAVFLGIPFAMGITTRYALQNRKREQNWYEERFLRRLKPTALIGLLFTLVIMFSLQGNYFIQLPMVLLRVAIPLVVYFIVMFVLSFLLSWKLKFSYQETATIAFTAASNNFELAIATAIAVFGLSSSEAFATTVGPLIEVPIMIGLVYVALWLKSKLFKMVGQEKVVMDGVSKGNGDGKFCSFGQH